LASRRRRRKSIGKVIVDVERRVRRVEKRPGAKRLKTNVVTTEKLGYRAVSTKTIQPDAVTANEAEFGVTVVSPTDPDVLKEGTTVVDPTTGATKVYSTDINDFVTLTDPVAQEAADGKNSSYYQDNEPTGGTYLVGDMWFDTNDDYKLYVWDGTAWVLSQDSATAQTIAESKNATYRSASAPVGTAYSNGDTWIDTGNSNKLYVWVNNAWISAQDGAIGSAQSAATAAQNTADGKNTVYYQTTAPGSTPNVAGDIWWQYSSGVIVGQWTGAGGTTWNQNSIGSAVIANLDVGKLTAGTISVAISLSSAGSITGGVIRTAASGTRIEMTSSTSNILYFYGSTSQPGALRVDSDNINLWAPGSTFGGGAEITMYSDTYVISPSGVFIRGGNSKALNFSMSSTTITLNQGTYGLSISSTGTKAVGASAEASEVIRNIRITQTAPTSGGDSSAYTNGTVVLVREA
jgi:hypothetical protein